MGIALRKLLTTARATAPITTSMPQTALTIIAVARADADMGLTRQAI